MGFRFRKQLGIPGLKLNLTKHGPSSISLGSNGAKVNISSKGLKLTGGLPGSGLSYSTTIKPNDISPSTNSSREDNLSQNVSPNKKTANNLKPKCDTCGTAIRKGARFCSKCGQPIPPEKHQPINRLPRKKCTSCGKALSKNTQFCPKCGTPVPDYIDEKEVEAAIDEILKELDE